MATNQIIQTLLSHRTVRRYTDRPVTDEHIQSAVEAGQRASTSSAVQAYCMIRVTDTAARVQLAELCGNQKQVTQAGAFFVVCADTRRHRLLTERAGRSYEAALEAFLVAVIDASLFAQNVAVAFESLGYGMCYIGALRNRLREVDALLQLPHGIYPLFGLCVGIEQPADAADSGSGHLDTLPRPRLPRQAVCFDDRYPADADMLDHVAAYDIDYAAYLQARGSQPRGWSDVIANMFTEVRRPELAAYYREKGANPS